MTTLFVRAFSLLTLLITATALHAQVPQLVNYQGRVAVNSVNFNGIGAFKFALVNTNGSVSYWSNDGASTAGSPPTAAVSLGVTNGLYSVLLGDTSLANMTAIPASVWANADVRLRVWFNDGANGSQLLVPDQRLAPNGYLPDGSVTAAKLAAGALGTASLAPVVVSGTTQVAAANTAYTAINAGSTAFTLPPTANVGDVVQITGAGAGGWSVGTWTAQSGAPSAAWQAVASSADGTHLVAVVVGGQIYTSANSGLTWTAQSGAPSAIWRSVASSSDGTHLVAAVHGGQIYTSPNSGVTWTAQSSAPTDAWTSVASSSNGSRLVAVTDTVSPGGLVYTSSDFGTSWTQQTSAPNPYWRAVASSADGLNLVAAAYLAHIYTSTIAGSGWGQAGAPTAQWSAVASSSDGSHLVAAAADSNGMVYTSTNYGLTWTAQSSAPATTWQAVASSSDGSHLVAAVSGGLIYNSTDGGVTWSPRSGAPNASWTGVASSSDGTHLVAVANGGQIYTTSVVSGAQGSTAIFQYLGNGQWAPVGQSQVAAGAIRSAQLGDDAVQTANIAGEAVGSAQIANGAVGTTQIAIGAVSSAQIANGGVGAAQLAANAVQTANIAAGAVGGTQIANGAVGAAQLAANAVQTANIAAGAVGSAQLAQNLSVNGNFGINGGLNVDSSGANIGNVNANALTFGLSSGEGIASNRFGLGSHPFDLEFWTDFTNRIEILQSGYVGIGTTTPSQQLEVNGSFIVVDGGSGVKCYLGDDGSGNDVQLGSFKSGVTAVGLYNIADNAYMHLYCSSITIEGGADLAEPFPISTKDETVSEGAVVVIDEANPGQLTLSTRPYDTRVAGVVSGAKGIHAGIQMQQQGLLEGGKNVALTGRVYVQADTSDGPIKPGDLLTTSGTPGKAMKVTDHARAQGAILGKAMSSLDEGSGMVLVLVTLQ